MSLGWTKSFPKSNAILKCITKFHRTAGTSCSMRLTWKYSCSVSFAWKQNVLLTNKTIKSSNQGAKQRRFPFVWRRSYQFWSLFWRYFSDYAFHNQTQRSYGLRTLYSSCVLEVNYVWSIFFFDLLAQTLALLYSNTWWYFYTFSSSAKNSSSDSHRLLLLGSSVFDDIHQPLRCRNGSCGLCCGCNCSAAH